MNFPSWLNFLNEEEDTFTRHFRITDCTESEQLLFILVSAGIPPQQFSVSAYSLILREMANVSHHGVENTAYEVAEIIENSDNDAVPIERLKNLADLSQMFVPNFRYAQQGCVPDVLNEFPAQRLIQVQFDLVEPVNWTTFWTAHGGKLHGGEMAALKWDPVWWKISFLGLPVAPFQLGSGYDLEDVDRDEAESLGLLTSSTRPPALKIDIDQANLHFRLATALTGHCS